MIFVCFLMPECSLSDFLLLGPVFNPKRLVSLAKKALIPTIGCSMGCSSWGWSLLPPSFLGLSRGGQGAYGVERWATGWLSMRTSGRPNLAIGFLGARW